MTDKMIRYHPQALFTILLYLVCGVNSLLVATPSRLIDTGQWKLSLDVGLQPGSWMPNRYPGWGESGARLGLDVQVEFTERAPPASEFMLGMDAYELCVTSPPSTFVSERGQEQVKFKRAGGWSITRPTGDVRNANGGLVKPEGILRFWLDCSSGAKRRDVEIPPDTRIFFTTGVWDDPLEVQEQDAEYRRVLSELDEILQDTRQTRQEAENQNILQNIQTFTKLFGDSRRFDELVSLKERYERELPPSGTATARNGVKIAPTGSMVIKGNGIPDWMPGSEYLIFGTFSTSTSTSTVS